MYFLYVCTIPNPPGPALPHFQGRVRKIEIRLLVQHHWLYTYFYEVPFHQPTSFCFRIVCFRWAYLSEYPTIQKIKYQENFLKGAKIFPFSQGWEILDFFHLMDICAAKHTGNNILYEINTKERSWWMWDLIKIFRYGHHRFNTDRNKIWNWKFTW